MIEQPRNYGLDEFPDVIIEVRDDQLTDELEDVYVEQMRKRDQDPNEDYNIPDEFRQVA
ncbi:hypothetical protein HZS55_12970 [Halosimplex rubrum]|uniref:Uncharacterized protein n=1 Tax=Halosimplex rubrum TaxID=869889 RepID=A0A7D5PAB0_9EURY|nr:hypothetical protein [Halosimplex rubrum]QLH78160.1 hypothetical protein HZS55_12970 [Halosimplex rubrum]